MAVRAEHLDILAVPVTRVAINMIDVDLTVVFWHKAASDTDAAQDIQDFRTCFQAPEISPSRTTAGLA
jgi:hypothetical protein